MRHNLIILILLIISLLSCKKESDVTAVTLSESDIVLYPTEEFQLEVFIEPLSATIYNSVKWESSNTQVAIVDKNGGVTAVYVGTALITATCDGKKATCKVTVMPPKYEISFENGADYLYNGRHYIKLYQPTLSLDQNGDFEGNGLFLNIELNQFKEGQYALNQADEWNIYKGEIAQIDGTYIASGTYLGQYTDYGLSVLFIASGEMTITHEGENYHVVCSFVGADNEPVNVEYEGTIEQRKITDVLVKTLNYTDFEITKVDITQQDEVQYMPLVLHCGEVEVHLTARVPLSVKTKLPQGKYETLTAEKSFSLTNKEHSYPCYIKQDGDTQLIETATLRYDGQEFYLTLTTEAGEKYNIVKE